MGTKLCYRPGSFYRVDDLTGFPERAENTKKTWQGYYVRPKSWEPRNAQDFVRGRRDLQAAPEPRPRQTNVFLAGSTAIAPGGDFNSDFSSDFFTEQSGVAGSSNILISPIIPFAPGNVIAIMLDNGVNFYTEVVSAQSGAVALASPLPFQASGGNTVVNGSFVAVTANSYQSSVS